MSAPVNGPPPPAEGENSRTNDPHRRRVGNRLLVASRGLRRPIVLDEQSSDLYEEILSGRSIQEIVARKAASANVAEQMVQRFVDQLIQQLHSVGLDPTTDSPDPPFVRSRVSPRIASPLLKGAHISCGVSVGGRWINLVVRSDLQHPVALDDRPTVDGVHADAAELFLVGRVPLDGGAVLVDHEGTRWLGAARKQRQTLLDSLYAAMEWENECAVSLRGSLIRLGSDLVLIDPKVLDNLKEGSPRSRISVNDLPIVGLVGADNEVRYAVADGSRPRTGNLRAVMTTEPCGDDASAVSLAAGFLRDPTDLVQAELLTSRLRLITIPAPSAEEQLLASVSCALNSKDAVPRAGATKPDGANPDGEPNMVPDTAS